MAKTKLLVEDDSSEEGTQEHITLDNINHNSVHVVDGVNCSNVYIALDNINHNNTCYAAGDVVDDLTDKQARALFEAGVINIKTAVS